MKARAGATARAFVALPVISLATALLSVSCAGNFPQALRDLDESLKASVLSSPPSLQFEAAERAARRPADWLSLLSRARVAELRGDGGRYLDVAEKALAKASSSRDVARAAADAYLRTGRPEAALGLFPDRLLAEDYPGLWTEAMIEALRKGRLPPALNTPSASARLAQELGDPRFYVDAALLAKGEGDLFAARSWLGRALEAKAKVKAEVLWDLGLHAELSRLDEGKASPAELRLIADASWMEGREDRAEALWKKAISLDPRGSWRTYASLAALSSGELSGQDLKVGSRADLSFLGPSAAGGKEDELGPSSWYGKMIRAFPSSLGARTCYAGALIRLGRKKEALAWLELPPGRQAEAGTLGKRELLERLTQAAFVWPEDRLMNEAERLAALYPRDGDVLEACLSLLLERGNYEDFLVLFDSGAKRGVEYGSKVLHAAYAAMARGKADEAIDLLGKAGPSSGGEGQGPAAAFALGVLLSEKGVRGGEGQSPAEAAFSDALQQARTPQETCAIYKEMGMQAERQGDRRKAQAAFAAAFAADPSDAEASRLSRR